MPKHLTTDDAPDFVASSTVGATNGVAPLGADSKVPTAFLPASATAGVDSVNGKTGDVLLVASDVGAVAANTVGNPNGVAPLDAIGRLPVNKLPTAAVQTVNGYAGPAVTLAASDVGAMTQTTSDARYVRQDFLIYNVLDHGVVGNGTTDDLAAIDSLLNTVYTAGGGTVFFPPGRTYAVSDYMHILGNTRVVAHGATIKGIANRGLAKLYRDSDTTFTGYTGHSRIRIEGGIWDVNAADAGVGTATAIVDAFLLGHNNDVIFNGVTIRNVSGGHALDVTGVQNLKVLNCRFEGFKDNTPDQSSSFREAIQLDFAVSGSGINGAFDNTPSRNILVQGCYFGASSRLGGFGRAVGSHSSANATTWIENVQIVGNQIEATLQEGIRAYAWRNVVIADNVVAGNGAPGIIVTGPDPTVAGYAIACQNVRVHGNVVAGPVSGGSSPIRVVGFTTARPVGVAITGNTVTSSPSTGIYVSQADTPQIANNKVLTCSTSSIYAINCTAPAVTGNHVSGAGGASIGVDTCTGGHVASNDVENAGGHGILVTGGSDVMVTGNRVYAANNSGIRATTSTARCRIIANTVIRGGTTDIGLDVTASATDCLIVNNDLTGGGWTAAGASAYNLVGTRQLLDWTGGSTVPGQNLAN